MYHVFHIKTKLMNLLSLWWARKIKLGQMKTMCKEKVKVSLELKTFTSSTLLSLENINVGLRMPLGRMRSSSI
ncbi:hypothetical protein Lalb_Chr02g0160411 [Lupinus albus]|uniref:Uncharacterized protein n=1 Tax=Lupinus albus TaxID=3870 RepID=A0A6A4R333_LUPAL|nr:hypothetical protein Lalb_Chr02g0160411 [Lupinus albus]